MKWLIPLLGLTVAAPTALAGQDDALKVLVNALGSQRDVRATLVQTRSDGKQEITVTVQIVPRRGIFARVTMPAIYAGMVSFDDGTTWKNYDPQLDLLRIEPSPSKFHFDMAFRRQLIEKNYLVSLDREALVAGRRARVVVLRAKAPEMADRRLYVDSENSLILRYIVREKDGTETVTIDTKSVDVESSIDLTQMMRIGDGAAKVEKAWGPIELRRAGDAARYTGFEPVVPDQLPSGFAMQAIHVVGTEKRSFVGVRLTDGMAVATVYLWATKEGEDPAEEPFHGKYDARGDGGIRCKVVGEVADRVRSSLARLFAGQYQGPSVPVGTPGPARKVEDRRTTGGGTGETRPKLVIDSNEKD